MKLQRVGIYARVSTDDQSCEAQISELREYSERRGWRIHRIYRDQGFSGSGCNRPGLNELLADCNRRRIDVLLVQRLDRLGRSLRDLLNVLDELRELGVDFASLNEALDSSTSAGKLLFHLVAAFAEYEKSLIAARVRAGLENARKRGRRLGRPPLKQLSPSEVATLQNERLHYKVPYRVLADKWGISVFTAHALCNGRG